MQKSGGFDAAVADAIKALEQVDRKALLLMQQQ